MEPLEEDELEGFEYFLTEIQQIINNFNIDIASKNLAYDKGYLGKDDGFAGRVVCGRAEYAGQLKKDGKPMWHCPYKFPREFYVLVDKEGQRIASSDYKKDLKDKKTKGLKVEKVKYGGCPAFSVDTPTDLL
jgi:hypothetical protein